MLVWQLFVTCGVWLGFTANCIVYRVSQDLELGNNSWRYMIFASCMPALLFLILVLFCAGKSLPTSERTYLPSRNLE